MATGRIGTTPVLTTRWSKAPAAGTTSLSGLDDNSVSLVYSVGYEAVYQNGVLLSRGNDYTATNGTTITLTTATVAGDIIEVFANQTIPLTDTYSQTVSDGRFIKNTLTTTTGDIIYASAANTPARLGIGSTNQVLTVSGGVPTWATPSSGGMTLISTTTLSGASVTLSSIPQTYNQLKIYVWNVTNNNFDGRLTFKPNNGTNHRWSGTDYNAVYSSGSGTIQPNANMSRTNGDNGFCFTIDNYTSAAYYYVFHLDGYYYDGGNPRGINISGSGADGTITSFVLSNTGGTFAGGTMQLYGVK